MQRFVKGCTLKCLPLLLVCLVAAAMPMAPAAAQEDVVSIEATPVSDDQEEETPQFSAEAVDAARVLNPARVYGLVGFWALIVLAIVLIRMQVRADEQLYHQGYYSRELE